MNEGSPSATSTSVPDAMSESDQGNPAEKRFGNREYSIARKKLDVEEKLLSIRARRLNAITPIIAVVGFGFLSPFWQSVHLPEYPPRYIVGSILIATAFLVTLFVNVARKLSRIELEEKRELLRARRMLGQPYTPYAQETPFLPGRKDSNSRAPNSYFDRLVEINVTNLESYYSLVKAQTNKSFLLALSAGGIGFCLIAVGLIAGFNNQTASSPITFISAGAGVLTEFIAGVFFYLYSKTVRQLKEYHDSLLAVQNILLSFKIVEDTSDAVKKTEMMEHMIGCLVPNARKAITKSDGASGKSKGRLDIRQIENNAGE